MKICAVILNYFGYDDTVACVESLAGQEISHIVILENSGSTVEKSRLQSALANISTVDIISGRQNLGFARGVNYILRQYLSHPFDAFLILNNDTIASPTLIEKLVNGMEQHGLDWAAPVIYHYPETDVVWSGGNYYNRLAGLITHRPRRLPGEMFYLTGCCLLVKRCVFERAGLLDESFFMYGEDIEFSSRAQRNGFVTGIIPDASLYHRASASARNNSLFYEYHLTRGHFLLSGKLCRSQREVYLSSLGKMLCLGLRALIRTMRYGNANALQGYARAIKELPEMIFRH